MEENQFLIHQTKSNNRTFKEVFQTTISSMSEPDIITFGLTAWSIWYSRNRFVFEDESNEASDTVSWVRRFKEQLAKIEENTEVTTERENQDRRSTQSPLGEESYKINVDAAVKGDLNRFGLGFIIQDSKGLVMAAADLHRKGSLSVLEAEAMAVLGGVTFAREMGFLEVSAKTKSSEVAGMLNGS